MAKSQFVAPAVVLQRWGKRKRADSDVDSDSIEEERPANRRAIGAGVCQHRSVRPSPYRYLDRRCGSGNLGFAECNYSVRASGTMP